MIGHGLTDHLQVAGVKQAVDVLHTRDDFVLREAQLQKCLGGLVGDLARDEVVLPQVQPGGFQHQLQPLLVQVCFITHGGKNP
ncbi:hypothetical protein D3C72_2192330 [compost metagenome]